jgi:hypothetical protein
MLTLITVNVVRLRLRQQFLRINGRYRNTLLLLPASFVCRLWNRVRRPSHDSETRFVEADVV